MRRKLIKWIIVAIVMVVAVFAVYWFANRGDADEARQACVDYVADQSAVGKPVSHAELLAFWRESEGKNLLEEPEISAYIDASPPMSSLKKDDPLTIAAVDRLLLCWECRIARRFRWLRWVLRLQKMMGFTFPRVLLSRG